MKKNIDMLIEEMEYCRKHKQYTAAMALAFILIDTCGKVKYPDKGSEKRSIEWFDQYIGNYEKCPDSPIYLSGGMVYALRCNIIHQSTNYVSKNDKELNYLYEFAIDYSAEPNQLDIYCDIVKYNEESGLYIINPNRFCFIVKQGVKGFLKEVDNNTFDFMKYKIEGI